MKKNFGLSFIFLMVFGIIQMNLADVYAASLKEISWALPQSYAFAVDVPSYDGDILQAGQYKFEVERGRKSSARSSGKKHGEIPIFFEIFVTDKFYSSIKKLNKNQSIGTVGGMNTKPIIVDLKKGQYVCLVFVKTLQEPTGMLTVRKVQ